MTKVCAEHDAEAIQRIHGREAGIFMAQLEAEKGETTWTQAELSLNLGSPRN
jgi:hypothetical protein